MAITAAAEKTTAAFFMGFPFTKILVDNKSRIRWLRPQGPLGTFSLNLMLMNARWFARDVGILKCQSEHDAEIAIAVSLDLRETYRNNYAAMRAARKRRTSSPATSRKLSRLRYSRVAPTTASPCRTI
jgi:hypothetical protein